MLAAGLSTAVLAWLFLTTVQLLSADAVLALTLAGMLAAALVARRYGGRRRLLAFSGAAVAALPLRIIAILVSGDDG